MKETLVDFYSKKYYEAEVKFRELKLDLEKKELLLSEAQDRISKLEQTPALSIVMSALLDAEIEYINSDDFFSIQDRKTVALMTVARIRERTISYQEIK